MRKLQFVEVSKSNLSNKYTLETLFRKGRNKKETVKEPLHKNRLQKAFWHGAKARLQGNFLQPIINLTVL